MTRKDELTARAIHLAQESQSNRPYPLAYEIKKALLQVEREVWDAVIAGYLQYKQSLIPKPGCEKFPMPLLMNFEDWCRQQKEAL